MLRSRLALRWDTHLANLPCFAFGPPTLLRPYLKIYLQDKISSYLSSNLSFFLVPPCVVVFVTALRAFRYGRSCVSLRRFVRFVVALCAFRYGSSCVWAPILPTSLTLCLGAPLANSPCLALGQAPRAFHYGFLCVSFPCILNMYV
jgi:hypothetical protein